MDLETLIHKDLEIVILVGNHCSGKTTIAKDIYEPHGYKIINSTLIHDMLEEASEYIGKQSIVFDSLNSTIVKRKYLIDFAKKHKIYVKCVYIKTPIEQCLKWNNNNTPEIAFYVYRNKFQEPTIDECDIVAIDISGFEV
jgi:predicted kinase